jgi:alpha-ketoglutarate-dependent taurine dioxygenase
MLFFNQIQLHHISCLDPEMRASLLAMFREEDLPRNVYYGDGTPIEDSVVAEISALYEQRAVRFQWQASDVIMLDNMAVAHARDPFEGSRKILVAMADVITQKSLAAV